MITEKTFPDSTQVESASYNLEKEELELTFVKGAVYRYSKFPVTAWEKLLEAESIGTFLNINIKGKYSYEKINS